MSKKGNDAIADEAVDKHEKIMNFLRQNINDKVDFQESLDKLHRLANNE